MFCHRNLVAPFKIVAHARQSSTGTQQKTQAKRPGVQTSHCGANDSATGKNNCGKDGLLQVGHGRNLRAVSARRVVCRSAARFSLAFFATTFTGNGRNGVFAIVRQGAATSLLLNSYAHETGVHAPCQPVRSAKHRCDGRFRRGRSWRWRCASILP